MNRKTVSPSHDDRKSIDSKRGIFISKNIPQEKPSVIPYLNTSLQGIRESLDDIKNINSSFQIDKNIHIQNGNYQRSTSPINNNYQVYQNHNIQSHPNIGPIHSINFQEVVNRSTTPPKVKFNYATQNSYMGQQTIIQNTTSNQNIPILQNSQQHINYVPIIEGPQIKRTYVPMEIKNEVPAKIIINSLNQTPPYRNFQGTQTIYQKDEAYQILIKEYEKLYAALMKQTEKNKNLQILLEKKNSQSTHQIIQKTVPSAPYSDPNYRNQRNEQSQKKKLRKLSLDVQELHNLLSKIYQKSVKDIVNSRKQATKSKITELFESAKKQINNVSFQSVERTFTYQRI